MKFASLVDEVPVVRSGIICKDGETILEFQSKGLSYFRISKDAHLKPFAHLGCIAHSRYSYFEPYFGYE